MLGSALPSSATIQTSTSSATPTSPTRPSRLRGLSYLRSYTHNHLHSSSSRSETPPLTRSTSTPAEPSSREPSAPRRGDTDLDRSGQTSHIQSGENGWLPSVQGRSGLSRDSLNPTSSTESAHPETSTSTMTRNRTANGNTGPTPTTTPTTRSMARRTSQAEGSSSNEQHADASTSNTTATQKDPLPSIRFIPHHETRSSRPSLQFDAVTRKLKQQNNIIRVGRYSERDNAAQSDRQNVSPVGFKSKVVSRKHCEFWCTNGQWYVKDAKSSSGTFLNHVRLSAPGVESRPYPVNDGDVVQLGIDFKGGEEVIFRCVKIRVECNRGWQKSLNSFNTSAHKRLLKNAGMKSRTRDSDAASTNSSECSICLNPVAPCQALFVAPCSHVWHYKCVHNFIHGPNYPNFLCPNCRAVADLEADVEQPEDLYEESVPEGLLESDGLSDGVKLGDDSAGHSSDNRDEHHSDESPSRDENTSDDEHLSRLLETTSLHLPTGSNDETLHSRQASSQPMTIQSRRSTDRNRPAEILTARSATPTTNAQFALAAGMMSMSEGLPMTPRNDAGPFVFDGAGGRGLAALAVAEEDEPTSSPDGR